MACSINKYLGLPESRGQEYEPKQDGGKKALQVMERQLRIAPYLVGQNYTVVDIFLYAYTPIRMWQMKVGSTYQPFRQ